MSSKPPARKTQRPRHIGTDVPNTNPATFDIPELSDAQPQPAEDEWPELDPDAEQAIVHDDNGNGEVPPPPPPWNGGDGGGGGEPPGDPGAIDDALEPSKEPLWSQWNSGNALRMLRSAQIGVVRRTVRKMHIRLWHMPAARMRALFQHAGAPQQSIDLSKEVVDTCRLCREWQSAAPRTMTTGNFAGAFNDELQVDLLF